MNVFIDLNHHINQRKKLNLKGLVINYGEGGLQNGKIEGLKHFAPPLKTG